MPSVIQSVPRGLLSLLGIKSTGVNPARLPDDVLAVVDVTAHYGDIASSTASQAGIAAAGTIIEIENGGGSNPVGVAWRLLAVGYTVETFSAAGVVASIGVTLQPTGGVLVPLLEQVRYTAPAGFAAYRVDNGIPMPQPIVLPPGSKLRFLVNETPGGSFALTARALFVPMQL